jgi:DNA (cytosine-5)-methyltransferase 1
VRLLDLFCGAGGAAMGYHRSGFEVVGVDVVPQPRYPFEFHQADALTFPLDGYDAIHASPPCQQFTAYRRRGAGVGDGYPDLIAPVRERLQAWGGPYVIENIPGAPLEQPFMLCGSSFGLDVRRHRLFESNVWIWSRGCEHHWQTPRFPPASNRTNLRRTVEVGVYRIPLDVQRRAMGIDWMTLDELSEAIPPAYTEFIGAHVMELLRSATRDAQGISESQETNSSGEQGDDQQVCGTSDVGRVAGELLHTWSDVPRSRQT